MYSFSWVVLLLIFGGFSLLSFGISYSTKDRRLLIKIVFIALLVFSFFYKPSQLADIYRYKEELEFMKRNGAISSFNHLRYIYDYSTGFFIFMQIMAKLPSILFYPIVVTITYGTLLYIYSDSLEIESINRTEFAVSLTFLLCCVNFGIVTSNLRFCIAMSIGIFAIYRLYKDTEAKLIRKIIYILLLIIPVFIHVSAFIIPLIWVISLLYHVKGVRVFVFILPFILSFSDRITSALQPILGNFDLFNFAVDKYERYSNLNYSLFERTSLVYYLVVIAVFAIIIFTKSHGLENEEGFNKIYFVLALAVLGFIPIRALFYRTVQYVYALTPVYIIKNRVVSRLPKGIVLLLIVLSFFVLIYYSRFSTYYYM